MVGVTVPDHPWPRAMFQLMHLLQCLVFLRRKAAFASSTTVLPPALHVIIAEIRSVRERDGEFVIGRLPDYRCVW